MLAEIAKSHLSVLDAAVRGITLDYDSSKSQLTFGGIDGMGFIYIDEATELTVTLSNASFASKPITFISSADNFTTPSTPFPANLNVLTFQVDQAPKSYLSPLALSFNVNVDGVNGISSPPLFMVLQPDLTGETPSTTVEVQYKMSDGTFSLDDAINLANEAVLINTSTPVNITFNLSTLPAGQNVHFSSPPIIGPSWMTHGIHSGTTLPVTIRGDATKFGSFQFAVDVPDLIGGVKTVISPDPVIVNATIGDGTGT